MLYPIKSFNQVKNNINNINIVKFFFKEEIKCCYKDIVVKKIGKISLSIEAFNEETNKKEKITFYFKNNKFVNANKMFPEYDDKGGKAYYLQLFIP